MAVSALAASSDFTVSADAENGKVIWQSSDESVVTVDENGSVTAVSDGSAVLTATDEDGNELEQRTIIVGTMPVDQEESLQSEQTEEATAATETDEPLPAEPEETKLTDEAAGTDAAQPNVRLIVMVAIVVVAIVATVAAVLSKKQRTRTRLNLVQIFQRWGAYFLPTRTGCSFADQRNCTHVCKRKT